MHLLLKATQEELVEKGESLVEQLAESLYKANPELSEALERALPQKEKTLKFPVLQHLKNRTSKEYERQMSRMLYDIGKVLSASSTGSVHALNKAEEGFEDFTKPIYDKDEEAYNRVKGALESKGYKGSDFEEGGPLYGWSTNQLIDLAKEKTP